MLQPIDKTTTLTGASGTQYIFKLYTFDDFSDLSDVWKPLPALYLFTRRYQNAGAYYHNYIYLGETGDLSTRFASHHKEDCIRKQQSNCIGTYTSVSANENARKAVEKDILLANNFPCNEQNN